MSHHPDPERLAEAAACELRNFLPRKDELKPKERLAIPAQEMPAQDPAVRRGNIQEVALGYGETQARLEALRCLQC
jgi:glutamate synthase (NADPH/NADH) small chain